MKKSLILYLLVFVSTANATSINIVPSSSITGGVVTDPGFSSPQGDYATFTNTQNIALGHTAIVSGTIPGFSSIHNSLYLTDGNYGNGRSWIDTGASPFLTIDLASSQDFNTILFGRDRLGAFSDRNPGQFIISISDDNSLFTQVIDSTVLGFSGIIGLGETVEVQFNDVTAQYVRLAFANSGTAIDEIEIINNSVSTVPAPAAVWLLGSGLIGLVGARKKSAKLSGNYA